MTDSGLRAAIVVVGPRGRVTSKPDLHAQKSGGYLPLPARPKGQSFLDCWLFFRISFVYIVARPYYTRREEKDIVQICTIYIPRRAITAAAYTYHSLVESQAQEKLLSSDPRKGKPPRM